MKKSRFTESQIVSILKEADAGVPVNELWRQHGEEVLDLYLFNDLDEVREVLHHWRIAYNERRPHDALGDLPPAGYRRRYEAQCSTSGCAG